MQSRGSITGKHVAMAVLVLIVVNAQLTWWIIFATGQARDRLELERSLLEARARAWAEIAAVVEPGAPPPLPESLELVAGSEPETGWPTFPVIGDPQGRSVRPSATAWHGILDEYRRRVVMVVSEGAFFAVLLLVFMGLMWRTFRREVELERQHRNFLSAITHELRSPIAAIRIALETIASGRADGRSSERFVGNALADTERLDRLVEKVLQATQIESRSAGLHLRATSMSRVVEDAVAAFEPGLEAAGAVVDRRIEDEVWAVIDGQAMAIVVSNLVENALKYGGDPPRIVVELQREADRAVLRVSDNGVGIPDEALPRVFDRFYRVGDEMTRTSQGTGLGLYLVQRIVTEHRGTVEVAATGAAGTTMCVSVPGAEESGA